MTPAHDIRTPDARTYEEGFYAGTTSVQAADEEGWVVSVTPSGGWVPAVIAGKTGIGLSQRMQAFVLDEADCPFNVVRPGQRPRSTLTPSLALKDGVPYLAFSVQGGDSQDQNLLQFFLNMVEFGMNVQQACEAPNINSFQMRSTFDQHLSEPGRMLVAESTTPEVRKQLQAMGYSLTFSRLTSGPITAIMLDRKHGTMWGGPATTATTTASAGKPDGEAHGAQNAHACTGAYVRHDRRLRKGPYTYPQAKKVNQVDDFFGTKIADPYRWLEDSDAPDTRAWIDAQNALTFGYLEQIPERERDQARA